MSFRPLDVDPEYQTRMVEHPRAGPATEGNVATRDPAPRARHRKVHGTTLQQDEHTTVLPFVATPTDAPMSPAAPMMSPVLSLPELAPSTPLSRPTATEAKPARDPLFDNAKFVAIALVVVGHAIEQLNDIPLVRAAYVAIYSFHMPVFILIAGYLSRSFASKPRQAQRIVTGIVIPYLVFEVTYELFNHFAANGSASIDILEPSYAMWFLAALFLWRLTSPLWRALRPAIAVTVAAALSLASGLVPMTETMDLYRVFGFLPFFVLGLVVSDRYFDVVRHRTVRILAVPTLVAPFAAAYLFFPDTQLNWLWYTDSYEQLGVSPLVGVTGRAIMLVGSFVMLTAFLAVLPRRHTWITALGAGTLYVYLLHRFVVKGAEYGGLYEVPWMHTLLGAGICAAAALVVTLVLSSKPVLALFRPLVEPRLTWLFRPQERNSGGRRRAHSPTR